MALEVPQLSLEALLISLIRRIETLEGASSPGDTSAFFDFGDSSKGNAWPGQNSGYERTGDRLFGSGQLFVRTMFDAPTILFARGDFDTDNVNIGRIDFVPCDEFGNVRYPNGSDDAAGAIGLNMHTPNDGADPQDAYTHFGFQVIIELESTTTKPPRTVFRPTGQNNGELWGTTYDSSGNVLTDVKIFPRPDVFGS